MQSKDGTLLDFLDAFVAIVSLSFTVTCVFYKRSMYTECWHYDVLKTNFMIWQITTNEEITKKIANRIDAVDDQFYSNLMKELENIGLENVCLWKFSIDICTGTPFFLNCDGFAPGTGT